MRTGWQEVDLYALDVFTSESTSRVDIPLRRRIDGGRIELEVIGEKVNDVVCALRRQILRLLFADLSICSHIDRLPMWLLLAKHRRPARQSEHLFR